MIQTFLIIFNCIAFFASGGVLAFVIYALLGDGFTKSLLPDGLPDSVAQLLFDNEGNSFQLPLFVLAAVSGMVLFVSFLGCVGSCRQSRCLVALYFVCLFSFLLALMGATAYCFIGDPQKPVVASMKLSMEQYKRDNLTRVLWDKMQTQLNCCGTESIDDWKSVGWIDNCSAPWSCKVLEKPEASRMVEEEAGRTKSATLTSNGIVGRARRKRGLNGTDIEGDDVGKMKEDDKKADEALMKHSDQKCLSDFSAPHYNEGCLLKLQEVMQSYINVIGAIIVSVWAVVIVNVLFSFALCVVLDYAEYTYK